MHKQLDATASKRTPSTSGNDEKSRELVNQIELRVLLSPV